MKKRNEETMKEAKLALQKYEQLDLEGTNGGVNSKPATSSGRRVFGRANSEVSNSNKKIKTDEMKMDNYYGNSDSEDDFKAEENINIESLIALVERYKSLILLNLGGLSLELSPELELSSEVSSWIRAGEGGGVMFCGRSTTCDGVTSCSSTKYGKKS
ncbi:hypothetical protein V6N11_045208 [Hibiscus sabdariffa]|uniref:Uncharacterized protein n=1 Tax=Hibiscus sabdariffa TaxID=183260 RepID=A0ABR2NF01_9ROSI